MSECRDCLAGLQHCHGTVVHHASGRVECTEAGCETPEAVHALTIDCEAIGCTPLACWGPSGVAASAHRVS